ncbi:MAG TPA: hypothetical protein VHL59_14405 [Thermoanaerobaculia bacterium]|nr:hypothetical protein [Thermoanaerobaculia bacterium]
MADQTRFAVCINNSGYAASLELRKLYEVIVDPEAEKDQLIRIVDESGEGSSAAGPKPGRTSFTPKLASPLGTSIASNRFAW